MPFINDFVVKEDICNMKCKYCLTGTSVFKESNTYEAHAKKEPLLYEAGSELKRNMDKVTGSIFDAFNISILKISGGEVLLIKGLIDFIKEQSVKYKVIQILTNGLLLTPNIISQLKDIGNICIQISLDHHMLEGNEYRTPTQKNLQLILDNLEKVIQAGIPTEINCVLHNKNTPILKYFADYLLRYNDHVTLYPFPIRGNSKLDFYPGTDQLNGIREIIDNYNKYQGILPPKVYLEYLLRFLERGKREISCIFPKIAIGSFDDGNITACANYWFTSLGNILKEDSQEVFKKIGTDRIYNVLMNKRHRMPECDQCFTPWEILNLYSIGEISIDELCRLPLYSFPGVKDSIIKMCNKNQEI